LQTVPLIIIKRRLIITLLWVAYSFMLAHGSIPHHHHSGKAHHEHLSGHHHDPDGKAHNDNDHGASPIEYFAHSGAGIEFQTPISKIDCAAFSTHFIISFLAVNIISGDESPPGKIRLDDFPLQSRSIVSSKGLRAPPLA
jgi:hypothetical protein